MEEISKYINDFFDTLEIFEDISRGHTNKVYIRQSILEFLENETKRNAFAVYEAFFDSYRIQLPGEVNPFIDLLDILQNYEENAATLIDKQRDHYIHSVNVFILGLCIYSQNARYRADFDLANLNKTEYPYSYDTAHEEFFYRWGIASLFHDVGYPLEIIGKQITKFVDFTTNIDSNVIVRSHLQIDNFEDFNNIAEYVPKVEFCKPYFEKFSSCIYFDLLKPTELLAHKLHISLGLEIPEIKKALSNFVATMTKNGFIDHGFFSAIIILRWYGFLIQRCKYKSEYFFWPVVDSASAILLHNFYRNVIMKPPFSKGKLSSKSHPIAWLLILCDELQEWNREAYGIADKKRIQVGKVSLSIDMNRIKTVYLTNKLELPQQFASEKESLLQNVLDIDAIFPDSINIRCQVEQDLALPNISSLRDIELTPRPLIENLEKIAIAIHELYNQYQLEKYPEKPLEYPQFSDLPDSLKYSNIRQARSIAKKIKMAGWEIGPKVKEGLEVKEIPEEIVELLAMSEHEDWMHERYNSGFVFGTEKDSENKVSPYLIPYSLLPEEIKEYDRNAVRNLPKLLNMVGLAIFIKK